MSQRKSAVILGAQWGDEGKGKIVDVLSEKFSVVARYAGGHNAGHTVIIKGKKFVLQLIPCGVLRPECKGVIGNGVVLDPMAFLNEVKKLKDAGLPVDGQLFVSNRAQVILPYHRMIELAAENAPGRTKIGTTSRGIGPAYEDKMHRSGLRVVDLLNSALLRTHIENACHEKNTIAHALFGTEPLDPKTMYEEYARAAEQVAPFVTDTAVLLNEAIRQRREGDVRGCAGGAARHRPRNVSVCDVVVGDGGRGGDRYGSRADADRHGDRGDQGVCDARGRRAVPDGDSRRLGDLLRARGQEYGAVTGRPRRCGWLDLPLLRYSNMINGTEWLVVTKMDVMDECAEIPVCTGYKIDGKVTDVIPADMRGFESIQPMYTKLKGWKASTEGITEFDKLPKLAQDYLQFIEKESGAKIGMVSTGPDRDQTMTIAGFEEALKA